MPCYHLPRLPLALLLILVLLAACGDAAEPASEPATDLSDDRSGDATSMEAASGGDGSTEGATPAGTSNQGCPLTETPSETYAGDLPFSFSFQHPSGWNVVSENGGTDGTAHLSMQKSFEVGGRNRRLALELVQAGQALSRESLAPLVAPTSIGGLSANQEQEEIEFGGETITVGKTVTDIQVVYKMGVPGEDGYRLTTLHMWWDSEGRCKDDVMELGSGILKTFALR